LAWIPADFKVIHSRDFDPLYMGPLFRRGYDMAVKGYSWEKQPPGL